MEFLIVLACLAVVVLIAPRRSSCIHCGSTATVPLSPSMRRCTDCNDRTPELG